MISLLAEVSWLEAGAVVLNLLYLVLAIRQNIWCWPAALLASVLSTVLFVGVQIYMEAALQVFYAGMAVYGWRQWLHGDRGRVLAVTTWRWQTHTLIVGGIVLLSGAFAWLLGFTNQAMPLVDSFTTVGAIATTYMVAKKVLENWIYWLVIDSVTVFLYWSRELPLYTALFVVYVMLVFIGYVKWRRDWRESRPGGAQ